MYNRENDQVLPIMPVNGPLHFFRHFTKVRKAMRRTRKHCCREIDKREIVENQDEMSWDARHTR